MGHHAPKAKVLSLVAAVRVLRHFMFTEQELAAVAALHVAPALTAVQLGKLPAPDAEPGEVATEQEADGYLPPLQPLPVTLPDCTIPAWQLKRHYSLPPQHAEQQPLASELAEFKHWAVSPVQLNRDRRAVGSRSWENISSSILQYLGFLHHHVPDQGRVFSLSLLLDASLVAAFISFQLEKGLELNTMLGLLSHLRRGLDYLAVESDLQQGRRVQQVADWMGRLGRQLGHTMPRKRKDPEQLRQEGQWLDAHEVVAVHESLRLDALKWVPAAPQYCSPWAARQLHDACLANMSMGYLPPFRAGCLISIQVRQVMCA